MKLLFTAALTFATLANGQTPSVSIMDNVTNSTSVLTAGNPFSLNIYNGSPYGAVVVVVNGSWTGNEGNADGYGNFVLNGTTPNNPGEADSQVWSVNGVAANPNPLNFTIGAIPTPAGIISAIPNPCSVPVGSSVCTTTVSWSSQNTSEVQVWVSVNGGTESLFASSGVGGTYAADAPWIQPNNAYSFVLYAYQAGARKQTLQATPQVTGTVPPPGTCIGYYNQ